MSVRVARGCLLPLAGTLAEAWGWNGRWRSVDEKMWRHAVAVWIIWEDWRSSLIGCAGEVVVAVRDYAYTTCCCLWALHLPPCMLASPQHFWRVLARLWTTTWKEETCFYRYNNLTVSWNQNLAGSVQPFVLLMLSNILKVLFPGWSQSLSSPASPVCSGEAGGKWALRDLSSFSVAS